jgi:hypothetical protein
VVTDLALELKGYNTVAAVAAVIRNALHPATFVSALAVVRTHNIQPHLQIGLVSAVGIAEKVVGCAPISGRHLPWEPAALAGHYALFGLGTPRVLYGQRSADRRYQLYDPMVEQIITLGELQNTGSGPFLGYLFAQPVGVQPSDSPNS